jgi:c-di-GMP-binding flagellar brake protein YcgR
MNTRRLRVFERVTIPGEVLIHDETFLNLAPLGNLSAGGMFVPGLTCLPLGSPVRIVIKSPSLEYPIQALGRIVRVEQENRRGLAVEFTSISSQCREIIQNCVYESRIKNALDAA